MNLSKLCPGCFEETNDMIEVCSHCGFSRLDYEKNRDPKILPSETILNGRYLVGGLIRKEGNYLNYQAYDLAASKKVLIREFLPELLCERKIRVKPSGGYEHRFMLRRKEMLPAYQEQIRYLSEMEKQNEYIRYPHILTCENSFLDQNILYFVSSAQKHIPFAEWEEHGEDTVRDKILMFVPMLLDLSCIHQKGIVHYSICPENLFVDEADEIVLGGDTWDDTSSKDRGLCGSRYHAPEQYTTRGSCGPATDVYALAIILIEFIFGIQIPDVPERLLRSEELSDRFLIGQLERAKAGKKLSQLLVEAISISYEKRPQSAGELALALETVM